MANDIGKKTPGQLIDELQTVNMKLFANQDRLAKLGKVSLLSDNSVHTKIAFITKLSLSLNSKRNQLIIAIDEILGYGDVTYTKKTYE